MNYRFLYILLLSFGLSHAQENTLAYLQKELGTKPPDSTFVSQVNRTTESLRRQGKFNNALVMNSWLLSRLDSVNPSALYITALQERSEINFRAGNYNASLSDASKGLRLAQVAKDSLKMAGIYNQIGSVYYRKNELDSTLYYYEQSYQLKIKLNADPWKLAISAYNKALVQIKQLEYDTALASYLEASDWYKKSDSKVVFLPRVYSAIAMVYRDKTDFVKAQEYAALALKTANEQYQPGDRNLIIIYNHQASLALARNDFKTAQPFIKKSLAITTQMYGENHFWPATVYGGLAKNYLNLKQVDSAYWAIDKAIVIGERLEEGFDFGDLYHIKSEILLEKNNPDVALQSVKQSREHYANTYGKKHWRITSTWLQQAKVLLKKQDVAGARKAIDSVFVVANYQQENLGVLDTPFIVLEALQLKFGFEKGAEKWNTLLQHLQLIPYVKSRYDTPEAKLFFASTTAEILSEDISFCYSEFERSGETKYLETAFRLMQLQTNNVLAEELAASGVYTENKTYQSVIKARKNWAQIKEALYNAQEKQPPQKKLLDSLLVARIEASKKLEEAIAVFQTKEGTMPLLLPLFSTVEVQQKLQPHQQLLQFYVGKKEVYGILFTENSVEYKKLALKVEVLENIMNLRQAIQNRKPLLGVDMLLYNQLLSNFSLENDKELILITDNALSYIPFDVLKNSEEKRLIEITPVSYLAAVSLLNPVSEKITFENSWSGFAVNYSEENLLPQSKIELDKLNSLTGGTSYFDQNVTQSTIFESAGNSKILHLALHGTVNESYPLYSQLILKDTIITASAIYNEHVASRLVVLNACETGYGSIADGEGVMSFSRAFTMAGAGSTVTSLWRIPDSESASLMVSFYKNLEKGMSKNKALQQAKIDYLKTNKDDELLQHPYYWAGFMVTGDTAPIQSNTPYVWHILLGVLLLAIVFFVGYRKRAKKEVGN